MQQVNIKIPHKYIVLFLLFLNIAMIVVSQNGKSSLFTLSFTLSKFLAILLHLKLTKDKLEIPFCLNSKHSFNSLSV